MASSESGNDPGTSRSKRAAGILFPDVSASRWTFERLIAEGGTGFVHQVFDRLMERRVALKLLKPELADEEHGIDLFLQEPRVAARLPHPNIVPIYEVGKHEEFGCFFTMELVLGRQLEELIRDPADEEWGPVQALPLVDVYRKVCDALAFAHSRGVAHADLKPDNIRVGEFGQVYLLDWGLARVVDRRGWELDPVSASGLPDLLSYPTLMPGVSGTPAYMAPEIVSGEPPGLRTDVFAMGVTLYRIVTRERPFAGKNVRQILNALRSGDFLPPRESRHGGWIPVELERIVLKAMALDPEERYPDASALALDLRRLTRSGAHFPVVQFAQGDRITQAGQVPAATYVILQGRCGIYSKSGRADELLDEVGPGQILGEEAILPGGGVSPTSVVALEPTSASRLARETARTELSGMAPWVGTVLKVLAQRNQDALAQRLRSRQAVGYLSSEGADRGAGGASLRPDRTALTRRLASSRLLAAFAQGARPEQLLDQTCEYIFESFRTIIPFDRLAVALLEQGGGLVRLNWMRQDYSREGISVGHSSPLENSSLRHIVRTQRPRIIEDLREYLAEHPESKNTSRILNSGVRSSLTCPLVAAEDVMGFLFFSSRWPGTYRDSHVGMFLHVASAVSALVDATRSRPGGACLKEVHAGVGRALLDLSRAVERARDEVPLLAEVACRSRGGQSLAELLDHIFDAFGPVLPYDRIGFASLEDEGKVARARWVRTHGDVIGIDTDYRANIESSSLAEVLATGRPRVLNDLVKYLEQHPDSESTRLIVSEGIRSSMTCPLSSNGAPFGFLFFSSRKPRAYGPSHVDTFLRIADQLAISVERADMNRALREARSEIERLRSGAT